MKPRESMIVSLAILLVLSFARADDDTHHHRVIIHVPYKIHTIHHTVLKHVHHDKGSDDRYEVLGYTVGKPINPLGHHFESHEPQLIHPHHPHPYHSLPAPAPPAQPHHVQSYHHHYPEPSHHEFEGGNELGHGFEQEWTPSHGFHNDFADGSGHRDTDFHYEASREPATSHEYAGHQAYAGYD